MMLREYDKILRPDAKGRISLGKFAEGVSSYRVYKDEDERVILEPFTEIPLREQWLYKNKKAHKSVLRGIEQSKAGRVKPRGSFSKHMDEEE